MSFRCDNCHTPQPTGTAPTVVVTHKRSIIPPPGSHIVKESKACAPCAEMLRNAGPVDLEPIRNEAYFESLAQMEDRPSSWR